MKHAWKFSRENKRAHIRCEVCGTVQTAANEKGKCRGFRRSG